MLLRIHQVFIFSCLLFDTQIMKNYCKKINQSLASILALACIYLATQFGGTLFGESASAPVPPGSYRVLSVADGDTFVVSMDGIEERVRLVGVDTPETHHPSKPAQCFGPEASNFTKSLLEGKTVKLSSDTKQPNRDKYSRLLRYAYTEDGRELNELLVSQGYAFATQFNTEKKQLLQSLQAEAKGKKAGVWNSCSPTEKNGIWRSNDL